MAVAVGLAKRARSVDGVEGWPFRAVSEAMEVIPRTLIQNAGGNAIRTLTTLRVRPLSRHWFERVYDVSRAHRRNTRRGRTSLASTATRARSSP
jgi:chaperonin GroEL (HSP60 family)